jgi:hypothetical protein
MRKIKLISIFDKHEDFIKMQYNSIIKHVKGEYEYIVFNNAMDENQANLNQKICDELNIKCIKLNTNYTNLQPSNLAGGGLNQAFTYVANELVFKIDSDMFFISDININDLFYNSDLIYVPTLQKDREIMWSGIFGLNLKKIDISLDFNPGVVHGTDTFGQSCKLTCDNKYNKKKFEIYFIADIIDETIHCGFNNDCSLHVKNNEVIYHDRQEFYDINVINKNNRLPIKFKEIVNKLKKYEFPLPYYLDIIEINNIQTILHYKSASWDTTRIGDYVQHKKNAINNFLKDII